MKKVRSFLLLRRFWQFSKKYAFRYGRWYLLGAFLVVLTQMLVVLIIEFLKNAVDAVTKEGASPNTVIPYVYAILGLSLVLMIVRTLSRLCLFSPARWIEFHIRKDYFEKLLFLDRFFFAQHESGDLVSRCANDVHSLRMAYGYGVSQIVNVVASLSLGLSAMIRMDGKTTLYLVLPVLLTLVILRLHTMHIFQYWRKAGEQMGDLSSFCLSSLKAVALIQSYQAESNIENKFESLNHNLNNTNRHIDTVFAFVMPLLRLIGDLSIFGVLWFAGPKIINEKLTLGQITAFFAYIAMVMPPILTIGWILNLLSRLLPAVERLEEVLWAMPKKTEVEEISRPLSPPFRLMAKGLEYRYEGQERSGFTLRNIHFDLPPGKVLGITGNVGSGKTTLLETLLRFHTLAPGQLCLNGQDCATLPRDEYLRFFSFAPQQALLFSTTLRENLLIALPESEGEKAKAFDPALIDSLHLAGLDLTPELFPEGLDTQVGEKGIMLSGGQRQRIALARALLKKASFYLLDDVLSAVDYETERKILLNLKKLRAEKSLILVSHRLSVLSWADEILVMKEGAIEHRGKHDELLQISPYYRDVHERQKAQ